MLTVSVPTTKPYEVRIGGGLLAQAGAQIAEVFPPCRLAVVTDSTVDPLYGDAAEQSLREAGFSTLKYVFPAGEAHKRLSTLEGILEFLAENHLTRTDAIVALGGGVVGDMAGFAAAVYARGIRFIQIPTTLLAAVDSSVGGKTAVDLAAGKNLAGAFHQPSLVLTDTEIIRALPAPLLSDGAAEVIKYGVLANPELFGWMLRPDWTDKLDEIIARCVAVKRDFVVADEFDNGARRLLNLGHTFGHAIERCSDFSITHGQGVAIGMALAAGAAELPEVCRAILDANRVCGLPVRSLYPAEQLSAAALSDKKRRGNSIALILPKKIGECTIQNLPVDHLEDAFRRGIATTEALL